MGCDRRRLRQLTSSYRENRLNILIYARTWAPSVGGVETITASLARGFADLSKMESGDPILVTVVTLTPADRMNDSRLPFEVIRCPSFVRFVRLVRSASVIHLAGPALLPLSLAWFFRKPVFVEHHNYQSVCPNGLLIFQPDHSVCPGHYMGARYRECIRCNVKMIGNVKSVRDLILMFPRRWLLRRVTANVAPTFHVKKRISLPRTEVILHGVPPTGRDPITTSDLGEHVALYAFVGRLVKEKGVATFLRAASELSQDGYDFRLIIVGDGPERVALEILCAELGLTGRTTFAGSVSPQRVALILSDATAVVIPSVWEEVAGLVAFEQMMLGNLVIASDIGGLGEEVNGFGLKFPAGDSHALALCMRRIVDEPESVAELRKKAQLHALETYAETRMVNEHLRLYTRRDGTL
jgi:glycosyltransferase involved in cell wall biosynthesis